MCIAKIYVDDGVQREEVMRDVVLVEEEGGGLSLTGILGEEKLLQARIKRVDFLEHSVLLEKEGSPRA
jgi:predicted RNA-binding protein